MTTLPSQSTFDVIERMEAAASKDQLVEIFRDFIKRHGVVNHAVFYVDLYDPENTGSEVMVHDLSPDWVDAYIAKNFKSHDPTLLRSFVDSRPFFWSDLKVDDHRSREVLEEARRVGMADGYSVPVFGYAGRDGMVSLAFDRLRPSMSNHARYGLHLASQYLFACLQTLIRKSKPLQPDQSATARERECIWWLASGKNVWEISVILNCAESTVREHLKRACQKMDCVSYPQLIARSIKRRIITP